MPPEEIHYVTIWEVLAGWALFLFIVVCVGKFLDRFQE